MTRAEQETLIRWDAEEREVHVWSADPAVWRQLARLGVAVLEETRPSGSSEVTGRFYRRFRSPASGSGCGASASYRRRSGHPPASGHCGCAATLSCRVPPTQKRRTQNGDRAG